MKIISHSIPKAYWAAVMFSLVCISCGVDSTNRETLARAFEQHLSNVQVEGEGTVSRILPDDNVGSSHQKFIVQLVSGQTVLIEHNIDLAPRVDELNVGDVISFSGEYVWNEKGGLIHWTHHDPAGRHQAGWIKFNGLVYQ